MADYFTKTSFAFTLPEAQAKNLVAYISHLSDVAEDVNEDEGPEGWPDAASVIEGADSHVGFEASIADGFDLSEGEAAVWIRDDEGMVNIDLLVYVLEEAVRKFEISKPITFEWANDCSKPRIDAYGGGSAVIGRMPSGEVVSMTKNSTENVGDMLANLEEKRLEIRWVLRDPDQSNVIRKHDAGWITVTPGNIDPEDMLDSTATKAMRIPKESCQNHVWVRSDLVEGDIPTAGIHSDDHVIERRIDVRPWLQKASFYDLESLAVSGWEFSEEADNVAHFLSQMEDPSVESVMDYLDLHPESMTGEAVGFGLWIEEGPAMEWLAKNRPEIHDKLKTVLDGEDPYFEGPM